MLKKFLSRPKHSKKYFALDCLNFILRNLVFHALLIENYRFSKNSIALSLYFKPFLGIDFSFKLVKVKNKMVKVQIW